VTQPNPVTDDQTVTVRVPITIRQRGGRKLVLTPDGRNVNEGPVYCQIDNAMIKAIARAFRWRDTLENGTYCTIREIAAAEKINETYIGRVLRLTLLAPEIVEAILSALQPTGLQLDGLMRRFPVVWKNQPAKFFNELFSHAKSGTFSATNRPVQLITSPLKSSVAPEVE